MQIPQQITSYHHLDGLVDLVLYTIAKADCLSFSRAAYFVDNPDFNHLRGVCGFCVTTNLANCAQDQKSMIQQIQKSPYNCRVKTINQESLRANNIDPTKPENVAKLCESLEIKNPKICNWDLKHNNYGLLIFETATPRCCNWKDSLVQQVSQFLGMCAF
jgi:hypothetical protein